MSPELAGRFLTTRPPGMSFVHTSLFFRLLICFTQRTASFLLHLHAMFPASQAITWDIFLSVDLEII